MCFFESCARDAFYNSLSSTLPTNSPPMYPHTFKFSVNTQPIHPPTNSYHSSGVVVVVVVLLANTRPFTPSTTHSILLLLFFIFFPLTSPRSSYYVHLLFLFFFFITLQLFLYHLLLSSYFLSLNEITPILTLSGVTIKLKTPQRVLYLLHTHTRIYTKIYNTPFLNIHLSNKYSFLIVFVKLG